MSEDSKKSWWKDPKWLIGLLVVPLFYRMEKPYDEWITCCLPVPQAILYGLELIKDGQSLLVRPDAVVRSGQPFRLVVKSKLQNTVQLRVLVRDSSGKFKSICKLGDPCATLQYDYLKQAPAGEPLEPDSDPADEELEILASKNRFPSEPPEELSSAEFDEWKQSHRTVTAVVSEWDGKFRVVRDWMLEGKIIRIPVRISHLRP